MADVEGSIVRGFKRILGRIVRFSNYDRDLRSGKTAAQRARLYELVKELAYTRNQINIMWRWNLYTLTSYRGNEAWNLTDFQIREQEIYNELRLYDCLDVFTQLNLQANSKPQTTTIDFHVQDPEAAMFMLKITLLFLGIFGIAHILEVVTGQGNDQHGGGLTRSRVLEFISVNNLHGGINENNDGRVDIKIDEAVSDLFTNY